MEYFNSKEEDIRSKMPHSNAGAADCIATLPSFTGQGFSVFEQISVDDLTKVVMAARSTTCSLDPLPAWVVQEIWSTLGLYVSAVLHAPLSSGTFPACFKNRCG